MRNENIYRTSAEILCILHPLACLVKEVAVLCIGDSVGVNGIGLLVKAIMHGVVRSLASWHCCLVDIIVGL